MNTTSSALVQASPSLRLSCSRMGTLQESPGTVTTLERDAELRLLRKTMKNLVTDQVITRIYLLDNGKAFTVTADDDVSAVGQTMEDLRMELLTDPHAARILAERAQQRGELPS